ncbi:single-stranded DNA-binding protein [Thermoflavimicrobium dichotomicum]|uniref:Single-stranded DNA-binding protein n=1 Tax=Thermoflavimicrobium dichotomicum TaxID=46223 RepID=A0A1I3KBD1_9BACL|nr:single-stranded DNA-binding protein [Thermoflavimicrobium dichotomicum]SFI69773.1 single-strand DNA-binding protein [Thermoflavimicrobium dichotomicum]
MLNRVILIGRLARDPELRYTPNGVAVTRFVVAVNRNYTNQQGEREADFIPVVTWRGLAENCANFIRKGSLVGLEGRIQVRSYENQEGRTVWTTEVVADDVRFLEPKNRAAGPVDDFGPTYGSGGSGGSSYGGNRQQSMDDPFADDGKPIDISDDDLPF